jgi:hypothetical protein
MTKAEIKEYVDRLFAADRKAHYRQWASIPIIRGGYIPGEDNVRPLKKMARKALEAREWFKLNGPADLQPLPLNDIEREDLIWRGVDRILAKYARSLETRKYNTLEHPSFVDYACGVMASEHARDFMRDDNSAKERFKPRPLAGLGPGLYWYPPKEHARIMASHNRSLAREAAYNADRQ